MVDFETLLRKYVHMVLDREGVTLLDYDYKKDRFSPEEIEALKAVEESYRAEEIRKTKA